MELKTIKEVCQAFAEDRQLQWKAVGDAGWRDLNFVDYGLQISFVGMQWRIKPTTVKYRRYLAGPPGGESVFCVHTEAGAKARPLFDDFIRWIDTDWQEVEV